MTKIRLHTLKHVLMPLSSQPLPCPPFLCPYGFAFSKTAYKQSYTVHSLFLLLAEEKDESLRFIMLCVSEVCSFLLVSEWYFLMWMYRSHPFSS